MSSNARPELPGPTHAQAHAQRTCTQLDERATFGSVDAVGRHVVVVSAAFDARSARASTPCSRRACGLYRAELQGPTGGWHG